MYAVHTQANGIILHILVYYLLSRAESEDIESEQ